MPDERCEYVVNIGGIDHTMLMTADDAVRYGEAATLAKAAKTVADKARKAPLNKNK